MILCPSEQSLGVYREKGTGENITFEKADIIPKYIAHCFLRYVQPSPVVEHFPHLHGAHFSLTSLSACLLALGTIPGLSPRVGLSGHPTMRGSVYFTQHVCGLICVVAHIVLDFGQINWIVQFYFVYPSIS